MATSDERKKGKCEELAVELSIVLIEEAISLRFVLCQKKTNTPEAVSGFETLYDPASTSHSSQQVNPLNPPTLWFKTQEVNRMSKLNPDRTFQTTFPIQNCIAQFSLNYTYAHGDILE